MADLAALTGRIRREFPDLAFERARLDKFGDDHRIVVLDEAKVFRFPRPGRGREALFGPERALLAALRGRTGFAIPDYRWVSAAGDFGGYPLIEGTELRAEIFAGLSLQARTTIFDALADFLILIHSLPADILAQSDGAIAREWDGAMWRRRWIEERRAQAALFVPADLLDRADRFYDAFAAAPPAPREVVTHGDMSSDHMLLAPTGDRLAGIIDFGDACLGDPAYDLTFFFAYGEDAASDIFRRYDPAGADPDLITRARRSYVRFRMEQLRRDWPDKAERVAELHRQMDTLGIA